LLADAVEDELEAVADLGETRTSRQRRLRQLPLFCPAEYVAAIYPVETYQRLAAVKRQYDPGNLFARDHNIRPY
jgi:FAD/FMN-containing dehydrogenase